MKVINFIFILISAFYASFAISMTLEKAYKTLEIPYNSDLTTSNKVFKKLSLKWHPDRNFGNEKVATEKFKEINSAFEFVKKYLESSQAKPGVPKTETKPTQYNIDPNKFQDWLSSLWRQIKYSRTKEERENIIGIIDAMIKKGFNINTTYKNKTLLDMARHWNNEELARYIIRHGGKIGDEPACCKQRMDGENCEYSDDCRGSCKCVYPTIAKKCAFGAGGTCINQAKYCDPSKCKFNNWADKT